MGCNQSRSKKGARVGRNVANLANAFERGEVNTVTAQGQNAEAERRKRQQLLRQLRENKQHQAAKKAAERQIYECFKDKPPTGGGPVR